MKLLYFGVPGGNFGDDLNLWIWDDLLPGWRDWTAQAVLVGVGTILKRGFLPEGKRKLVLGSGIGYGLAPDITAAPDEWDIRAVRGPLSASGLGLSPDRAIVDAAVMLPTLPRFSQIVPSGEVLFVPHHASWDLLDWDALCKRLGIVALSPTGDAEAVVRRLASARMVIAESMHAAIIADAFRVPWQAVSIARQFNTFKWRDWGASVGIEPDFARFFPIVRGLQRAKLEVLPRKRKVSSDGLGHAANAEPGSLRSHGLQRKMLEVSALRLLSHLSKRNGQLSDGSKIENAQAAFNSMLQGVVRDYGQH